MPRTNTGVVVELPFYNKEPNYYILHNFLHIVLFIRVDIFKIKGSHLTTIKVKENEPFEVAMRRFKRTIEKTGLITELRARQFYEKPTAERKRKLAAAVKRTYKRLRSQLLQPKLY